MGSFKVDKEMNSFGPTDTAIPDLAPPPGSSLAQLAPEAKRMGLGVSLPRACSESTVLGYQQSMGGAQVAC